MRIEKNIKKENRIINVSGIIIGIVFAIWFAFLIYTPQPTNVDYEALYELEDVYIHNVTKALEVEGTTVVVTDERIIVKIEGEKCLIRSYFDRNFNYVETLKESTVFTIGEVILGSLTFGMMAGVFGIVLTSFVIMTVKAVHGCIKKKINSRKTMQASKEC